MNQGSGSGLPEWVREVRDGAATIPADRLTRFVPPDGGEPRRGAVLVLFAERASGPELLLTERAHHMRSHPGQVSFPGGSIDTGETAQQAALREAWEETGLKTSGVRVLAELPELWLPPSNFAVTPVLAWWEDPCVLEVGNEDEVHAIHHVTIAELLDPEHRISVRHPSGWVGPGFLIGEQHDVILWGFTGGIVARLFDYLGWTRPWDTERVRELPDYMVQGPQTTARRPDTRLLDMDEDEDR